MIAALIFWYACIAAFLFLAFFLFDVFSFLWQTLLAVIFWPFVVILGVIGFFAILIDDKKMLDEANAYYNKRTGKHF